MKGIIKNWKILALACLPIVSFAVFLRLRNLTILPVFVDEAIYIRWSQIMAAEPTLRFLPLSDGKQPLFMWILMFFIKRFSDPLFVGRLLSVASGVGTMAAIFVLSYLLFKNKLLSLFSIFLYSLSPFSVFFDRMALVDSMLCMFGVWTAALGLLTVKHKRLDFAMLTGFSLGFASLTKSPAIFFAILLPVAWLIYLPACRKLRHMALAGGLLSVSYVLAFAMYNIQRLGPNFQLLTSRTGDYVSPISHLWTNFGDPLIPHLKDSLLWFWTMGPSSLLPMLLLGLYFGFKKYPKETLFLSVWFLFPLLIQSELAKAFTARYIFFTLPYMFILSGVAFFDKSRIVNKVMILITIFFVVQAVGFDFLLLTNPEKANLPRGERSGYLEEWTAGQGIKEISQYLKLENLNEPNRKIVVGTEGYFGTLPDGLQMYMNDVPNTIVVGIGLGIRGIPQSLKESFEAGNKTYLVANKSRFTEDANMQGFRLISSYPKPPRRTDSKEYITKGPQEVLLFYQLEAINKPIKL